MAGAQAPPGTPVQLNWANLKLLFFFFPSATPFLLQIPLENFSARVTTVSMENGILCCKAYILHRVEHRFNPDVEKGKHLVKKVARSHIINCGIFLRDRGRPN